jgi:hypothetical protein
MAAKPHHLYRDLRELPDHCDIIGTTFYHARTRRIQDTVRQLRARCNLLLVVLNEPPDDVLLLIKKNNDPSIIWFSDFVPNRPIHQYHTAVNWWTNPNNLYVTDAWARKLLQQLQVGGDKTWRFDSLLGTTKGHRDFLHGLVLQSPQRHHIYHNYFADDLRAGSWDFDIGTNTRTGQTVMIDNVQVSICNILPVSIYNQSHYSIVSESNADSQITRFTEKTAKPLLALRPLIAFAGPYYLRNLQELGFKTFAPVIDETYDGILDDHARWRAAWQQVESLCDQDPNKILGELMPVLQHNRDHLLMTDWHCAIRQYLR